MIFYPKFVYGKRKAKTEKRYGGKMGWLTIKVTYFKKYLAETPLETLHKYRKTYYGYVKDCEECTLFI